MGNGFPFFPVQASAAASQVDALFGFLLALTVFMSAAIALFVVYFAVKYRRRRPDERPPVILADWRLEVVWIGVPFAIAMFIFFWGASIYIRAFHPPADAWEIFVVGKQWMWKLQHSNGRREINELHVPVGQSIMLTMTSQDVIHSFFVPAFRMKMDVVPGRYTHEWFKATKTGTYHLFCAQYCGTQHAQMTGRVIVMTPADYERWLEGAAAQAAGRPAPLGSQGEALFRKFRCDTCHKVGGLARAPLLDGVYGSRVQLNDGRVITANDDYIRESILKPQAKVVAGYDPVMPSFEGQISEEEIMQIIAYLKTLSRAASATGGQTNARA